MSIEGRVRDVISRTLGVEISSTGDIHRSELPKWDSLKHVELIFALEDEFQLYFDQEQMANLVSLSSIVSVIGSTDGT